MLLYHLCSCCSLLLFWHLTWLHTAEIKELLGGRSVGAFEACDDTGQRDKEMEC